MIGNACGALYLLKLKQGSSWRVKYRDVSSKQRETTIGHYPWVEPKDAKQSATHINNIQQIDPLLEMTKQVAVLESALRGVQMILRVLFLIGRYRLIGGYCYI
ncbi:MAG: integrase arm-type DNA-binding domain-containing protein [Motiliproteus sp.]